MKRLLSVCFALILTFALLIAACAEGIDNALDTVADEPEILSGMIEPEVPESEDLALTGDSFSIDIRTPEASASEDRAVSAPMPKAGNCAHSKYSKLEEYKQYEQLDSKEHGVKFITPDGCFTDVTGYFVKCDACGETGFYYDDGRDQSVTWESEGELFYKVYSQICTEAYGWQAHTFVNGKCSKCGYKGSSSANDDMPELCATRMGMGKGDILKLASSKKGYNFSSSDNKVARISKKGVITAVSVGKATITAKSKSGQKATCKVTVLKGPKKVTLNKSQVSLETGKTCQLKATLPKGTYTWNLTWTSSNKEVAKVSSKGKVTAVGNGTAKITVETAGGVKATCRVTVKTGTIDLTNYVGKDIKETAKKLNLTYNGYVYGNSYITIEEVRDYVTGKNGTFIAINKRNSKYSMAGVTYGMNLDKADKTLISNNWRRTEVDRSNDFVHHYYYQNSKGHEIDLYIYEPETNKNVDMIIVRQTKNERWPEL